MDCIAFEALQLPEPGGAGDIFILVSNPWGVLQNGWFIVGNLLNMDDLGVPLFQETSISIS